MLDRMALVFACSNFKMLTFEVLSKTEVGLVLVLVLILVLALEIAGVVWAGYANKRMREQIGWKDGYFLTRHPAYMTDPGPCDIIKNEIYGCKLCIHLPAFVVVRCLTACSCYQRGVSNRDLAVFCEWVRRHSFYGRGSPRPTPRDLEGPLEAKEPEEAEVKVSPSLAVTSWMPARAREAFECIEEPGENVKKGNSMHVHSIHKLKAVEQLVMGLDSELRSMHFERPSWQNFKLLLVAMVNTAHPVLDLRLLSLVLPTQHRAFILVSRINFNLAVVAFFFTAAIGVQMHSTDEASQCIPDEEDRLQRYVREIVVSITSLVITNIPAALAALGHKRSFLYDSAWSTGQRQRRFVLRFVQDTAFWAIGIGMNCFLVFYVVVFLTHVNAAGIRRWVRSISVSLALKLMLNPVMEAVACTVLSMLLIYYRPQVVESSIREIVNGYVARLSVESRVRRSDLLTRELSEALEEAFARAIAEVNEVEPHDVQDEEGNPGRLSRLHPEDAEKFVLGGSLQMKSTQTLEEVRCVVESAEAVGPSCGWPVISRVIEWITERFGGQAQLDKALALDATTVSVTEPDVDAAEATPDRSLLRSGPASPEIEVPQVIESVKGTPEQEQGLLESRASAARVEAPDLPTAALARGTAAEEPGQRRTRRTSSPRTKAEGCRRTRLSSVECEFDVPEPPPVVMGLPEVEHGTTGLQNCLRSCGTPMQNCPPKAK